MARLESTRRSCVGRCLVHWATRHRPVLPLVCFASTERDDLGTALRTSHTRSNTHATRPSIHMRTDRGRPSVLPSVSIDAQTPYSKNADVIRRRGLMWVPS